MVKNSERWRCFVGRKLYVDSRYVMSGASSFHAESLLPTHIDLFISDSFHISTLRALYDFKKTAIVSKYESDIPNSDIITLYKCQINAGPFKVNQTRNGLFQVWNGFLRGFKIGWIRTQVLKRWVWKLSFAAEHKKEIIEK